MYGPRSRQPPGLPRPPPLCILVCKGKPKEDNRSWSTVCVFPANGGDSHFTRESKRDPHSESHLPCALTPLYTPRVTPCCVRVPLPLSSRPHELATLTWVLVLSISLEISQLPSRAVVVIIPWKELVRVMLISVLCEYAYLERWWYVHENPGYVPLWAEWNGIGSSGRMNLFTYASMRVVGLHWSL